MAGSVWVGHGGICLGYRTILRLYPKSKFAFSLMVNASDINREKYVEGMYAILNKVQSEECNFAEIEMNKERFAEYTGYYEWTFDGAESYMLTWERNLVRLDLPSEKSINSMIMYKYAKDDLFRRVRKDGNLGGALLFERNKDGKVIQVKTHDNYTRIKIGTLKK